MEFTSLLDCLCGPSHLQSRHQHKCQHDLTQPLITEKPPLEPMPSTTHHLNSKSLDDDDLTTKILTILTHSPYPSHGTDLTPKITIATGLHTTDWTSYLAERVLHALEATLKSDNHASWGDALSDAYARAREFACEELRELWEYAEEHPYEVAAEVLLTLLALGVLARLVPAFVRVLGFGRLGPVEGSFAAWWQRMYGGFVPKGSVWSFLQRMGMTWE